MTSSNQHLKLSVVGRKAFPRSVCIVVSVWLAYVLLMSAETVTDTLMPSTLIPNIAQGHGLDLSVANLGVNLSKDQAEFYKIHPRYGLIGIYPVGMLILAAPIQGALWGLAHILDIDTSVTGVHFPHLRFVFEKVSASLLVALTVSLLYRTLVGFVPLRWAIIMSGLYTFGSGSLSLLGQGLWQHTGINLICLVLCSFFLAEKRTASYRQEFFFFLLVGFLFSLRPTALSWSVVFSVMFARTYRRPSIAGVLALVLGASPGLVWNLMLFANPLGGYGAISVDREFVNLSPGDYLHRLWLILFSFRRGFLIFNPILFGLFLSISALRTYRQRERELLSAMLVGMVLQILLCASYPAWDGGRCFGPRFMLDGLAIAFILAAIGIAHTQRRLHNLTYGVVAVVGVFSIILHVFGAIGSRLTVPSLVELHKQLLLY